LILFYYLSPQTCQVKDSGMSTHIKQNRNTRR